MVRLSPVWRCACLVALLLAVVAASRTGVLPDSAELSATVAAFGVGRYLGYDFVASRRHAAALNAFLHRRGLLGVLILRLLPIAPFGLVSYAFGVTAVRPATYLLATVIGIAPSTIVFASLGANALSPGTPAFAGSGAAALALTVLGVVGAHIVRRRERARAESIPPQPPHLAGRD